MDGADPYRVLGVRRDASADDVRRAFRRALLRYHPDVYSGDPAEGAKLFRRTRAAYEAITAGRAGRGARRHHTDPPQWTVYTGRTWTAWVRPDERPQHERAAFDMAREAKAALVILDAALAALAVGVTVALLQSAV